MGTGNICSEIKELRKQTEEYSRQKWKIKLMTLMKIIKI